MLRNGIFALALATVLASSSCATVPAPRKAQIMQARKVQRPLYPMVNIQKPGDFKKWEPILEKMTGRKPVPSSRVFLLSPDKFALKCNTFLWGDAGGCYHTDSDEIFLPKEKGVQNHTEPSLWDFIYSPLLIWVHEQGHHYQYTIHGDVGDETHANAFSNYFAEYVTQHIDRRLGIALLKAHLEQQKMRCDGESTRWPAVYSLLGSGSGSFREAWESLNRRKFDEESTAEGRKKAERQVLELEGIPLNLDFLDSRKLKAMIGSLDFNSLKGSDGKVEHYKSFGDDVTMLRQNLKFGWGMVIIESYEQLEKGNRHMSVSATIDTNEGIKINVHKYLKPNQNFQVHAFKDERPLFTVYEGTANAFAYSQIPSVLCPHVEEKDMSQDVKKYKRVLKRAFLAALSAGKKSRIRTTNRIIHIPSQNRVSAGRYHVMLIGFPTSPSNTFNC
jgi:hypothetical protein